MASPSRRAKLARLRKVKLVRFLATRRQSKRIPGAPELPVLSAATLAFFCDIFVLSQVTTDTAGGTLYAVVVPNAATPPTGAQIEAGQDGSGAAATSAANVAVTSTGTVTLLLRGLTAVTAYNVYTTHKVGASYSNVVNAAFTTDTLVIATASTGAATGLVPSTGCGPIGINENDPYGGTTAVRFIDNNDASTGPCILTQGMTFFNGVNKFTLTVKTHSGAQWQRLTTVNISMSGATHWNTVTGAAGSNASPWATPVAYDIGGGWMMVTSVASVAGADLMGSFSIYKGLTNNATAVTRDGTNISALHNMRFTRV